MPVTTRRSQAGGGVSRKVPARKARTTRSTAMRQATDRWQQAALANDDDGGGDGDDDDHDHAHDHAHDHHHDHAHAHHHAHHHDHADDPRGIMDNDPRAVSVSRAPNGAVDDAVRPVRDVADRVGSEAEAFAEQLDGLIEILRDRNRPPYEHVVGLVDEFRAIASEAAQRLETDHRKERAHQLRREWSAQNPGIAMQTHGHALAASASFRLGGSLSDATREKIALQRRWQQEADLWHLFRITLDVHHNPHTPSHEQRQQAIANMGPVHHYTTEQQLWDRFLLWDDVARERSLVKKWLEQTASTQASPLDGIVEELEAKAGRGKGLWSHGWMQTREQIKHEKRMRAWPAPDADPLPQLRSADQAELLVTSLDPDAATRQARVMDKSDAFFERAMWIASWEMLRRGKSWEEVAQWCRERHEGWRAIALGKGSDPSHTRSTNTLRRAAYLASKAASSRDDYEAAVYGLLAGNAHAMLKVCRSMDDHLYAHYSASLLRQFDQFLAANYPDRAPKDPAPAESLVHTERAIFDLLEKLRKEPKTKHESVQPMKIIQSYVIANDVNSMIHTLGYALSFTDQQSGRAEKMIAHIDPFWDDKQKNQPEEAIGLDPHALRIAAHMGILLDILSPQELQGEARIAKMNVMAAYIQTLRAAGKRDLIPVYASRLSMGAYVMVMSHVLEDLTVLKEQDEILKLLGQYKLDVVFILNEQLGYVLDKTLSKYLKTEKPINILHPSEDIKHPGRRIVDDILHDEYPEDDAKVLASLKWFDIVDGLWERTFCSLSLALRKALTAGRLLLAIKIVDTYPYEEIAMRKSYQEVHKSYNPMDLEQAPSADDAGDWERLRKQSRAYYELSLLVQAIGALAYWRRQEAAYVETHPRLTGASPELKTAKEAVTDAMEPVLTGSLLLHNDFVDGDEKTDCQQIRNWYVPELVIAYITVLHSAGHLISRDNLIDSMDLSVVVADDANRLSEAFVQAGRMRELVASFALTSKAMLVLKAEGKKWTTRKTKGREGKDLGIWEIGPQMAVRPGLHAPTLSLS